MFNIFNILGFSIFFGFGLLLGIALFGLWIWALVDCLRSDKESIEKLIWVLVIVFTNIIGAIIYLFMKDSKTKLKGKKLRRSKDDRIIAGVCGGIGEYLDIDPTIIRLLWVLFAVFSFGSALLIYIITALIIPENDKTKNKYKNDSKNSGKGIISVVFWIIGIFIVSIAVVSIVAITQYHEYSSNVARAVRISEGHNIALDIAKDSILASQRYNSKDGEDLFCFGTQLIDNGECKANDDPYGISINNGCYKVRCEFDSSGSGNLVEVIVSGSQVIDIDFEQMPKPIISTEQDCKNAGYEVVYPDLEGAPPQCVTSKGVIDLKNSINMCVDMCGDGVCHEIVCMGKDCPCPEDSDNCPEDCG